MRFFSKIFAIVSGIFLVSGVVYNPGYQELVSPKPQLKTEIGVIQTFDLPSQISYSEPATFYFGGALCNITSTAFDVGSQVLVSASVDLPTSMENKLSFIEVTIDNAVLYDPFSEPNNIPYPCTIYLSTISSNRGTGSQVAVFEDSGTVSMTIAIYYEYPLGSFESSQPTIAEHTVNVVFPDLRIGTGQDVQQQRTENLNLSLMLFVLFFASLNISVALYDHSNDKSKKPN
jgi:hypothetical protein